MHNLILLGSMTAGPAATPGNFRAGQRHEFKHGFFAGSRVQVLDLSCTREWEDPDEAGIQRLVQEENWLQSTFC